MTGSIYDWAVSPDSNQTADAAINWQEFQDPATVNNSARQMMARVSEWLKDVVPSRTSTSAVASTYNVSSNSIPSTGTIPDGFIISFIAHQTNTAAATLYLNSFGGAPLRGATGVALTAG